MGYYTVGMCETDTRRHYYFQPNVNQPYFIRVCDWLGVMTPVVIMPDTEPNCKNCLKARDTIQEAIVVATTGGKMKALSGYAEWFWLMAKGWKDIENRPKPLPYEMAMNLPVRIYLHASKSNYVQRKGNDDLDFIVANLTSEQLAEFCKVDWDRFRGSIIGEVTIVKQMRKFNYTEADGVDIGSQQKELQIMGANNEPCMSPWFFGPFGYVVKDGVLYDRLIPYKGQLGFLEVDLSVVATTRGRNDRTTQG